MEIRSSSGQVEDSIGEIRKVVERGNRALVTTPQKRMSEDSLNTAGTGHTMSTFIPMSMQLKGLGDPPKPSSWRIRCDCGGNFMREGLDLPEVELVAVLDADKEGFYAVRRLIQTAGRAARHELGK